MTTRSQIHLGWAAALFFTLPFLLLNWIVSSDLEPAATWLRVGAPGGFGANPAGYLALIASLMLIAAGGVVAARAIPRLWRTRQLFPLLMSLIVAVVLLGGYVVITGAWLYEVWRCDVLGVVNCD